MKHLLVPVDSVPVLTNIPPVAPAYVWYQHRPYCPDWDRYRPAIACRNRVIYYERQVSPTVVVLWIHVGRVVVRWKNCWFGIKFSGTTSWNRTNVAYPPRFFHREKNDSPFISVGSKNLFKVSGSLTLNFCWTPLYRNDMSSEGVSGKNKNNFLCRYECRPAEKVYSTHLHSHLYTLQLTFAELVHQLLALVQRAWSGRSV